MSEPMPGTSMSNSEREQHLQAAHKKAADAAKAEEIKDSTFEPFFVMDRSCFLRMSEREFG